MVIIDQSSLSIKGQGVCHCVSLCVTVCHCVSVCDPRPKVLLLVRALLLGKGTTSGKGTT